MDNCRRTLTASGVLAIALGTALLTPAAAVAALDTTPAAAPLVTVTAPLFIGPRASLELAPATEQAAAPEAAPAEVTTDTTPATPATPAAPVIESAPVAAPPAVQAPIAQKPAATKPVARRALLGKQVLRSVTGSQRGTLPTSVTAPAATAQTTLVQARPAALLGANPLAGQRFYVAASSSAAREANRVRATDPARAKGLDFIASQPTGYWWGDWNPTSTVKSEVARHVAQATANGTTPVYVIYNIMKRDGSGYSAGGAGSLAQYRAWVDQVVAGLGSSNATVIVEPDAVNDLYNMSGTTRVERVAALRYALTSLKAAGIPAYLDAGGPTIHEPGIVSKLLLEAGIDQAAGFAVNVSNFQSTSDDIAWGTAVSSLTGGKHFVIDTGRNGNGALTYAQDSQYWCNPPGRALGRTPTTDTGNALVDAFLWVKQPGESDGECRGFAGAGQFSADYAYGLYSRM